MGRRKPKKISQSNSLTIPGKNETNLVIILISVFITNTKNERIKDWKLKKTIKQIWLHSKLFFWMYQFMLSSFFPKEPYFCSFTFLPKLRTLHFVRVSLFVYYKHQSHENVRKMPTYKQNLCCIMKMRQGIRKSCPKKYMMLLVLVMWHFILKRKAES